MTTSRWLYVAAFMCLGLSLVVGFWPHHDAYYACGSAFNPERKAEGYYFLDFRPGWHPCRSAHVAARVETGVTIAVSVALAVLAWTRRISGATHLANSASHEVDKASH